MFHPENVTLRLFAASRLEEDREEEIERHLAGCAECRKRLADIENGDKNSILHEMKAAMLHEPSSSENADVPIFKSDTGGFRVGDRIGGNFRLERPLGRGGMGVAWKAFDETAERYVVLKFVPKEIQNVTEAMNAVRESFRRVHALQHQHICPLYGLVDDFKAGLFLVMKFVDGLSLDDYRREHVKEHGSMRWNDIVQILRPMAEALDYAHARKIIHRDIKPQNVMIGRADGVQIIDFGLADDIRSSMERITGLVVTKISGTRSYMAPEQWQGKPQDARTDQYALAVTVYELLAGHVPFQNGDPEVLRNCVLHESPPLISGQPEYVNIALLKALSKNREDRFKNCSLFVEALSETLCRRSVRNVFMLASAVATILVLAFFVLYKARTPASLVVTQSTTHITGDTREQGLSFVSARLIERGWNVVKALRRTAEYDFELRGKNPETRTRVKVKTVRGNNNFAFGDNLDKMKGDFWMLVKIPESREQEPTVFIMRPGEVEELVHVYGGNRNGGKPSCWIRPGSYEKEQYRNRWELLGSSDR